MTCMIESKGLYMEINKSGLSFVFNIGIEAEAIAKDKKQLIITLFLEGNFGNYCKTISKKMIMTDLQKSIRNKLSWLNCRVSVVDSSTYNQSYYKVDFV